MSHPAPPPRLLPAVILAGGAARRMGGGDKGLRLLGGRPMLAHVIDRLSGQAAPLAINANGDAGRWAGFGLPVLADSLPPGVPDRPGPLAGILAGLDWAAGLGAAQVLVVPSDTPFLPPDLASRLLQAAGDGAAVAARLDAAGQHRAHPTCAVWPVAARHPLRCALGDGLRRLGDFAQGQGAAEVLFAAEGPDPFFNVNTPEEAAFAEILLAARDAV